MKGQALTALKALGAVILFLATLIAWLPVSVRLTERLTFRPVGDLKKSPFPVLVANGSDVTVMMVERAEDLAAKNLPGQCLVPPGADDAFLDRIRRQDEQQRLDAAWTLNVKRLAPDRQVIELVRVGDGWWGGVYEATAGGVTPLYRKETGPGFALVFAGVALLMNIFTWHFTRVGWRAWRRRRT